MQKFSLRLLATLFSLLAFSSLAIAADFDRARPERLGMSSDRLERLDAVLKSYVDKEQIAGQVVLVLRKGRIAYSSANGMQDIEAGIPMNEDTMFRIASQTKAIVSAGIMILHERGDLDIGHPLERYIPEWENMQVAVPKESGGYELEAARNSITLRNLLTHTGGMSYGNGPAADKWKKRVSKVGTLPIVMSQSAILSRVWPHFLWTNILARDGYTDTTPTSSAQ